MAWINKEDIDDYFIHQYKNETTVVPQKISYDEEELPVPIKMWRENNTHFGVPRYFFRRNMPQFNGNNDIRYDVSEGIPLPKIVQPIVLRQDQIPVVDIMVATLKQGPWGAGLLEAYTGFGKSVCAIDLIVRLGGSALILVHSEPLMDQWIENIKRHFPEAKTGIVQADRCEYEDRHIVVGMVQSIMRPESLDKYGLHFFRHFRTLVVDEVHRMGSEHFGKAAPKFNNKYAFGMSGTIRRKDKCESVFKWVLGEVICKAQDDARINPIIFSRETYFEAIRTEKYVFDPEKQKKVLKIFDMNSFKKPTLLNFVARSQERSAKIAWDILKALKTGRNPLVMSERKQILEDVQHHIEDLKKSEGENFPQRITHGFYVGGKSKRSRKAELAAASRCDVVYATVQLAKEGIDIPRLETLFMATPLGDVEQLVGRICRPEIKFEDGVPVVVPKKHKPMVVDYVDSSLNHFEDLYHARLKQYARLGWKVIG